MWLGVNHKKWSGQEGNLPGLLSHFCVFMVSGAEWRVTRRHLGHGLACVDELMNSEKLLRVVQL